MSSSMVATVYFIALVVFFILLVVLTIVWIASRSGKHEEEDDTDEINETEESIFEEAKAQADSQQYEPLDSAFADDSVFSGDSAFAENSLFDNIEISDETYVNTFDDESVANAPTEELIQPDVQGEETAEEDETPDTETEKNAAAAGKLAVAPETEPEFAAVSEEESEPAAASEEESVPAAASEETSESAAASEPEPTEEPDTMPESELQSASDAAVPEQSENNSEEELFKPETLVDSAFAPEPEETGLTNEAIDESVREAMAMGAAVSGMGAGLSAASMFGVREELEKGSRKSRQRSVVPSTDDFFWFNKMDVAEKPSYKTAEMYYHYFDTAKDCIEDLLIEMYDCALVRTEEIRYIAYGIEPRAISMKEILSSGNYTNQKKLKEPTTQDLVRIYEKWCGYVDKLFDKVEIHADAYTIDEIRNLLCEFGRNDVDVLLEGK